MALAIQPSVALTTVGVFLLVLYFTIFVSLSSILAGIAFMFLILFVFNEKETLYQIFACIVALLVVFTHKKNILRLLKGTESKVPILRYRDRRRQRKMRD
jgi:glycerol-3-phosphate acyltransferase PlsY